MKIQSEYPCFIQTEYKLYSDRIRLNKEREREMEREIIIYNKVDFEKAYDSVEWSFHLNTIETMGFGFRWRRWIESCLNSASVSILVNRSPTKEFKMRRGFQQVDPLALFLFLLVTEALNVLMIEAKEKGMFKGILVGKDGVVVTHLQYADDIRFFGKWSVTNIKNLVKILKCFHLISGLWINLGKSKLYGVGVDMKELQSWANDTGCGVGSFPFVYLGLSVGVNMRRVESSKGVMEKMKKMLSSWKAKNLSLGGNLTLVQSVLDSLRKLVVDSFGEGARDPNQSGMAWLKWERVFVGECKSEGGTRCGPGLLRLVEKLTIWGLTSLILARGRRGETKFWSDRWVEDEVLCQRFERLWQLETRKYVLVIERGYWEGDEWKWRWEWRWVSIGREERDQVILSRFCRDGNQKDTNETYQNGR
ncbi:hypothetical protein OSB04_028466 [Centaurea solstitialis]|uniref:Reverse transcriptase domain-containing protein n=1 Tax=Centaurea solstitialis TaxID=347529 RepID=A0AA38ST89_9ASTR|nr:hypothetical protein OSB04_028466 [Centaurea solstitialis]